MNKLPEREGEEELEPSVIEENVLTPAEMAKAFDAAVDPYRMHTAFVAYCRLREVEVLALGTSMCLALRATCGRANLLSCSFVEPWNTCEDVTGIPDLTKPQSGQRVGDVTLGAPCARCLRRRIASEQEVSPKFSAIPQIDRP